MRISDWSPDVCSSDLAIGLAMLFALGQRTRLDLAVQHDRSPLSVQLSAGSIRNNYTLNLRNMELRPRTVEVTLSGLPGARLCSDVGSRGTAGQSRRMALAPAPVRTRFAAGKGWAVRGKLG